MSKNKSRSKRDTSIPRQPLLWLAAGLLFTLPPMFGSLATWVPIFFLLTLIMKFWMEPKGYRLRFAPLKLLLAGVLLGVIFVSYGSLKGVESGVSLLVVLMSLKILEAHTAREFQVLVLMAWVLCLCGFFLSQDFAVALCLLAAFAFVLVALIQFHRGASPGALWPPVATACKLLAQAVPLVVLLFLLFPRINTGFQFDFRDLRSAALGVSDRLSPGSIASLAGSSDIAFRASFPERKTRPPGPMYWRGVVMWHCEGMEWSAPYAGGSFRAGAPGFRPLPVQAPSGKAIRQRITMEPHGGHWMFALDRPFEAPSGATLAGGNYLWSIRPIRKARRYEVVSSLDITGRELEARDRHAALEVPNSITPAVRQLAESWIAQNSDPRSVMNNALQFFRTKGFRYSLSPGHYKKNDLEEFLLHRRVGFCEHYAASFATLMRLAGIPARVVVGYLGGEYNDLGRFVLVRQADSHAWCEVWLANSGWTRVDPTSVVVPGRANLGLNSFLERRAAGEMEARQSTLVAKLTRSAIFIRVRLAWEALNYQWDTRVLGFDTDVQEVLLASAGFAYAEPFLLIIETLVIAVALLVIYAGWMQLRTRPRVDRVKALYERFCHKATRLGVWRNPWEGPADFSRRAAQLLPDEAGRIRQISNTYIALRYSSESPALGLDRFAKEVNQFGEHSR